MLILTSGLIPAPFCNLISATSSGTSPRDGEQGGTGLYTFLWYFIAPPATLFDCMDHERKDKKEKGVIID